MSGDVALSQVIVQYNEEVRDPNMKKTLKQDWRSRWGYITTEVFEKYKRLRRGELEEKEAEERFIVYLPDGTLASVALAHMTVVDPFAVLELVKRTAPTAAAGMPVSDKVVQMRPVPAPSRITEAKVVEAESAEEEAEEEGKE
jgi:hypothetical protein